MVGATVAKLVIEEDGDHPRNGDRPTITPWMILPNLNLLPCVEVL